MKYRLYDEEHKDHPFVTIEPEISPPRFPKYLLYGERLFRLHSIIGNNLRMDGDGVYREEKPEDVARVECPDYIPGTYIGT